MNEHPETVQPLPALYSRSVQLCQQRALGPWFDSDPHGRALDIGCSDGAWSVELASRGWDVTGLAPNASALDTARRRADDNCVRCNFQVADVAHEDIGGSYDLILSVGVLQQIADHDRCADTLLRLSQALSAGGRLLLLEAAPTRRESRYDHKHFCARPFDWYRRTLADAGLGLVDVLGVDPLPFKNWLLPRYRRLPRVVRDAALVATSALSLPLDWLLGPSFPRTSWHKLLVAERTSHG